MADPDNPTYPVLGLRALQAKAKKKAKARGKTKKAATTKRTSKAKGRRPRP
jgi:hypothetical protein